ESAAETDGQGASGYDPALRRFEYDSKKHSWRHPGYPQDGRHPVVNVNWHDAQAFCRWLTNKEGRTYRLPTEAEWEYACRAGTTSRFTVGDVAEALKSVANLGDQSLARRWDTATVKQYGLDPRSIKFQPWDDGHAFTAPVGSFQPNALGLFDMLGNVGEFCGDGYRTAGPGPLSGGSCKRHPFTAASSPFRVVRGAEGVEDVLLLQRQREGVRSRSRTLASVSIQDPSGHDDVLTALHGRGPGLRDHDPLDPGDRGPGRRVDVVEVVQQPHHLAAADALAAVDQAFVMPGRGED